MIRGAALARRAARNQTRRLASLRRRHRLPAFARLRLARRDAPGRTPRSRRLRRRYPADLDSVPRIVVSSPNSDESQAFLDAPARPRDRALQVHSEAGRSSTAASRARSCCIRASVRVPQRPRLFLGTGQARSRSRRHDASAGRSGRGYRPHLFLHGTYDFDEVEESHSIIQYRAVSENLDAIGDV